MRCIASTDHGGIIIQTSGGVYIIICKSNTNFYIGRSMNYQKRMKDHFRELRANKHKNHRMQACFNKYSEDSFVGKLLFELPFDEYIQQEVEQILIDRHYHDEKCMNTNQSARGGCIVPMTEERKQKISRANKGKRHIASDEARYNISKALMGHKLSMETKKKISESHKGKTLSEEHRNKLKISSGGVNNPRYGVTGSKNVLSKSVLQIDINSFDVVNKFSSTKDVKKLKGWDSSSISKVCRNELFQIYGYFWVYENEYNDEYKAELIQKRDYLLNKTYIKSGKESPVAKKIVQINLIDEQFVRIFNTVTETKDFGYDPSSVIKVCKGKLRSHKSYMWMYYDEYITQQVAQ